MPDEKPLPPPCCPDPFRIRDLVAMAHVANVDRSLEFYAYLGFTCDSRFSHSDGSTNYASISSGHARLMLVRASGPIDPAQQAVLFYLYSPDVHGLRQHLLDRGLPNAGIPPGERPPGVDPPPPPTGPVLFEIKRPFYMPAGELRVHDPDGYCLLIGQLNSSAV